MGKPVDAFLPRGRFGPPLLEFEPVLPAPLETLTRQSALPKLVVVDAPPGYGKTVLLSLLHQRQARRGNRALWITLDDRDRSVVAVAELIRSAVAMAAGAGWPALEPSDEPLARPPTSEAQLLAELAALGGTTVLVIDNVHFCPDPRIGAFLELLTFATPSALRLVVSSTSGLSMDLVRAKLELGAQVIAAEQLCFDGGCVERLFRAAGQPLASPDLAAAIVERTEGWPAAVRLLLVLSQQSGVPLDLAIKRFSGENNDIASVLTRRVLAGFEPSLVCFLREIALLREFSAELATEVTEEPQAAEWIGLLLQRNLLVFPLDDSRRWLRMHTLLRQYLLAEGTRQMDRERRRAVLERAAHWHARHGDDATAIDLALDAPSYALASTWLERSGRTLVGRLGQLPRFMGWVEQLMAAGAPLALDTHAWYIWAQCFSLKYEAAQRSIEAFDARLAVQALPLDKAAAFRKRLGLLRVVVSVYLDNLDLARTEAAEWLADAPDQDALGVATVATGAAVGDIAAHDFVAARWHMEQAAGAIARSDSLYGHAWVTSVRACIELIQGDPAEADRLIVRARPSVLAGLGADAGVVGTMDFVHARALADLGLRGEAQAAALRGLSRAAQHGVTETARQGLGACVGFWGGEADGPWSPTELAQVVHSHGARMGQLFDGLVLRRLVQLGRLDEAGFIVERMAPAGTSQSRRAAVEVEASELALARIEWAMATGRHRDALGWIDARLAQVPSHGMRRERVELHLLAANGHVRHGDERQALRHLSLAIVHAARRHLVGPFREQAAALGRLLGAHADRVFSFTQPEEKALLARLRQWHGPGAPTTTDAAPAAPAATAPIESLTPREVQFLTLLSEGLNNQQIADRVGLSVPTVKWHFYNLYGKLSVKNRIAALVAARTLGVVAK